jgi:hypothetical protein
VAMHLRICVQLRGRGEALERESVRRGAKTLYLPDGRSVPECVIEARKQSYAEDMQVVPRKVGPRNLFAPGVPVLNKGNKAAQGMKKIATAGCIVKDGDFYYVLTNKPWGSSRHANQGTQGI